jgi:hypothetical protein
VLCMNYVSTATSRITHIRALRYDPTVKQKQLLLPVSRRAIFERVTRALAKKDRSLRAYRRGQSGTPGALYIVDVKLNRVVAVQQDLEQLGYQLGVLREYEKLEQIDEDAISDARDVEKEERKARRRR